MEKVRLGEVREEKSHNFVWQVSKKEERDVKRKMKHGENTEIKR